MNGHRTLKIGNKIVGDGRPTYIIAEIGINHNGSVEIAKALVDKAVHAGCDAVKFQKRTPELCVPKEQWNIERDTPWGRITYIDYRHRMEFTAEQHAEIGDYCKQKRIEWFSSCWDESSVDFMEKFNPPCYKIASACLTDDNLLRHHKKTGRPIILSTGMSTMAQITHAVEILGTDNLIILHCTSTYPSKPEELNLNVIKTMKNVFPCLIGYSGHEVGLATTVAAVALGACVAERHITLDRSMWGSDQSASIEPQGFERLVRDIRVVEESMGDGVKIVYDTERPIISKLRRVG